MKYLLTGGHVTPALAVIERMEQDDHVVFVGRKTALAGEKEASFEFMEITSRGIPFIHLHTGKLNRSLSLSSLRQALLMPIGLVQSLLILLWRRPDVVLTFGGYIALPIALSAWILRIPLFVHEQTIAPGLTNRLMSRFARCTFVTYEQTKSQFQPPVVVTGNPVRAQVFAQNKDTTLLDGLDLKRPLLLVLGGSLGSHSVNTLIEQILPQLKKKYTLLHQSGNVKEFDDFKRLKTHEDTHYRVVEHISSADIGFAYARSRIVIARSGANTVSELIALKKPAVLVPLPWSASGEQRAHARLLEDSGVAVVFEQTGNASELISAMEKASKIESYAFHTTPHASNPQHTILAEIRQRLGRKRS